MMIQMKIVKRRKFLNIFIYVIMTYRIWHKPIDEGNELNWMTVIDLNESDTDAVFRNDSAPSTTLLARENPSGVPSQKRFLKILHVVGDLWSVKGSLKK